LYVELPLYLASHAPIAHERRLPMPEVPDMEAIRDDPIGVEILEKIAKYEEEHLLNGSQEGWATFLDEYYAPMGGKEAAACAMYRLALVLQQTEPAIAYVSAGNLGTILHGCIMFGVELARRQEGAVVELEATWNAPEYGQIVPKPGANHGEGEWTGRGYDHA